LTTEVPFKLLLIPYRYNINRFSTALASGKRGKTSGYMLELKQIIVLLIFTGFFITVNKMYLHHSVLDKFERNVINPGKVSYCDADIEL